MLVQSTHYLKITAFQLLNVIDRCHLFIFTYLFIFIIIYHIFYIIFIFIFYHLVSGLYIISKCLNLFYYFISDIVIYLIYIDLMRKRCQLINVDVDVDVCFTYKSIFIIFEGVGTGLKNITHNRTLLLAVSISRSI